MVFNISSYLYLHHEEHVTDNWERKAIEVLNGAFEQYKIVSVEERLENRETAVKFVTYIEAENEERAETILLASLNGHDVDNHNITPKQTTTV